jgi:hypothetical protein
VNILKSSSGQTTRGGPPAWGLGVGLKPFTVKNKFVKKNQAQPWTWTDSVDKRLKGRNMDMRFGLWNVQSLYRAGSLMTVSKELAKYKLD